MGVGQNAARRKKLITTLVAAGLLVTVLGVAVAYWRGRAGREKGNMPVPPALPTDVHQQLSGYSFTRSEGGRQVFTIRASKLAAKARQSFSASSARVMVCCSTGVP